MATGLLAPYQCVYRRPLARLGQPPISFYSCDRLLFYFRRFASFFLLRRNLVLIREQGAEDDELASSFVVLVL